MVAPLLQVQNLHVEFPKQGSKIEVLRDVSFHVLPGETVCIVGESGSGKSMTALAMLDLVPSPGRISKGSICFSGRDLSRLSAKEMRKTRGNDISMIFQEPLNSLNPVLSVGSQIAEGARRHEGLSRSAAFERAVELLRAVGIPAPEERARAFPHEMSGGMRQRAMIAMAIACNPKLLIADEPTTALDVTVQQQILRLLKNLQRDTKMALVFITHDMGVVSEMADRVVVMYAGQTVEAGPVDEIVRKPRHPYTQALIKCAPRLTAGATVRHRLPEIPGSVPALDRLPQGCSFAPRCDQAIAVCNKERPAYAEVGSSCVACWVAQAVSA